MNRSLKGSFPFRLATTSFIYPDSYCANVRRLGQWVDEIELLVFESSQLPSPSEIDELQHLAKEMDLTYNVHLPLDVQLGHHDAKVRDHSIQALAEAIERTAPLDPTTHTLHLDVSDDVNDAGPADWQKRIIAAMSKLLQSVPIASHQISVETLNYNPKWLKPICDQLKLAVCVDVGHVLLYGFDLPEVFESFGKQITILHLHGVNNGKDHLPLNRLDNPARQTICSYLRHFTGSVSLEVFSEVNLKYSLDCLEKLMTNAHCQP